MQSLYESKYQVLLYSEKDQMLISDWKADTEFLNEETYLIEIHKLYSYFRRYKPLLYYCDVSNYKNTLSKDAQEFAANLFKNDKAKFSAIVTSQHEIAPTVEGVIENLEVITDDCVNRYFHDRSVAMNWLLSCSNDPIILKNSQEAVSQQ
ncbi:MAG: hypothetical protein H7329_17605 [Opitutaceae bacterium]|nr:hypothetical protein [Cytophagales bacterium]